MTGTAKVSRAMDRKHAGRLNFLGKILETLEIPTQKQLEAKRR